MFAPDTHTSYEETLAITGLNTNNWRLVRDYSGRPTNGRNKFLIIADNLSQLVKYKKDYTFREGFNYRGGFIRHIRTESDRENVANANDNNQNQEQEDNEMNFLQRLQQAMDQEESNEDQNMGE